MIDCSSDQIVFGTETSREPLSLCADPMKLKYADGELRNIEINGRRLLMRIYVAVRDRDWNTVPCVLTQTESESMKTHLISTSKWNTKLMISILYGEAPCAGTPKGKSLSRSMARLEKPSNAIA